VRLLCEKPRQHNARGPIAMPHRPIHPVLRAGARQTAQLWLQVVGYVGLLALFAMAAASLWLDLPAAGRGAGRRFRRARSLVRPARAL
jgi:hypothetical protein